MKHRNASLDVLRCLAIVAVLNCHVATTFATKPLSSVFGLGGHGVDLFFALSGWLLGHQLLKELATTQTIELRRFWARRWLRTLPAYYSILLFTYLWQIVLKNNWNLDYTFLFFGQTYLSEMPYFTVSWSLCVEEHFYLLIAPLLVSFALHRWGVVILLCLFFFPCIARSLGWYSDLHETHVRWDQCGVGVLLAYCSVFMPKTWSYLRGFAVPLSVLALAAVAQNLFHRAGVISGAELGPFQWAMVSGCFVLLANSSDFWALKLHSTLGRFLAERSYALYLTHVEAIAIVKQLSGISFWLALFLVWGISLVFAEILYRIIERPFIQSREWFRWSRDREVQMQS